MIDDPIVEEIRRFCREHAAQYGNNLQRIVEALREKEWLSDREQKKARRGIPDYYRTSLIYHSNCFVLLWLLIEI